MFDSRITRTILRVNDNRTGREVLSLTKYDENIFLLITESHAGFVSVTTYYIHPDGQPVYSQTDLPVSVGIPTLIEKRNDNLADIIGRSLRGHIGNMNYSHTDLCHMTDAS